MALISSRANPKIKAIRSLRSRKARSESGTFLVEGIRHVGEAMEAGARIEALYYAPDLVNSSFALELIQHQVQSGTPCYPVAREIFESVAEKENPQGILAVVKQPLCPLNDLTRDNFPWGVAILSPQDPGNLGAIMRTIDAVGASGMILLEGGVDPFHPSAVRASMGTLFWQKIVSTSFIEFSSWVRGAGYHVYGSSAHAALDYRQLKEYRQPCILLLGSEREGLTSEQAELCEFLVRLPMLGRATSLNLAVAAGILLYAMMASPAG